MNSASYPSGRYCSSSPGVDLDVDRPVEVEEGHHHITRQEGGEEEEEEEEEEERDHPGATLGVIW